MPWNMKDYPNSFKNFDTVMRKKAIDIANALLDEDYPEDRAIPIAIEQAKDWYQNASQEEKEAYRKDENPSKNDEHDSTASVELLTNDVKVFFDADNNEWNVQTRKAERADSLHDTKEKAVKRAEEIAKNKETAVEIYKKNGKLQEKKTPNNQNN